MRRVTKIIFTVSALLNVVMIGAVAGHFVKKTREHPWHNVREELSPETKVVVAQNFRAARQDSMVHHEAIQNLKNELQTLLNAEEFDATAFASALDKVSKEQAIIHEKRGAAMVEILKKLPLEERKAMGERFLRGLDRHPGRRDGRKRDVRKSDTRRFSGSESRLERPRSLQREERIFDRDK